MTFREPVLFVKRLVVLYRAAAVYDETFHEGVNIIRGQNGHGKSTIADFIFFSLGGEVGGWKPEAERCETVLAEVEVNEQVLTLRRGIAASRSPAMEIFWGSLDNALKEPFTGWQVFPFARSDNKESFSQILFRLLNFPEVRGDRTSIITMNQVLRLLYVDQLSNVRSLLRDEPFDTPTKRRAIGDLLYGIYNDQLYADELRLREVQRDALRVQHEYDTLQSLLMEAGQNVDVEDIRTIEKETAAALDKVRAALNEARTIYEIGDVSVEQTTELRAAEARLTEAKAEFSAAAQRLQALRFEVEDSQDFLKHLKARLTALDESVAAESALGEMILQVCPECLQPLDGKHEEGHCPLCRRPTGPYGREAKIGRMRHELATQIQESERLLAVKMESLRQADQEHARALRNVTAAQQRFDDLSSRIRSRRDASLDELFERKGILENQLESLRSQLRLAERLRDSQKRATDLKIEAVNLEQRIRDTRAKQDFRRELAKDTVNRHAVELLKRDLPREEWFQNAQEVKADFAENFSTVDGRDTFSASSITYLKSSVHFAIFFSSLELDFFRYPKFILNDNIEDKGMEDERSHNFQRLIVEFSKRFNVRHQIIVTTSKIAPEFEGTDLCVGPAYVNELKTLRFPK